MKPRVRGVVVVEGKYDKIRLESLFEVKVITTEGFGIFNDSEKRLLLRRLAQKEGLVVLCDPDGAGKLIRSHLHTLCGAEGITDLYVPPRTGKEKRKSAPSKEGLLGVEGIDNETLLGLFEKSGLLEGGERKSPRYTKTDLYRLGYSGGADSAAKRESVLERNALPKNLSANAFLDVVNLLEIEL
ncbi:MAG: DUF4093 domain-containing protein [Clostridia bacterium]|nr:DUF4093 domain-containing protein [Clostridia bacterium]